MLVNIQAAFNSIIMENISKCEIPIIYLICPQAHVDLNCKKKPVECPNSCGELIVREEVCKFV